MLEPLETLSHFVLIYNHDAFSFFLQRASRSCAAFGTLTAGCFFAGQWCEISDVDILLSETRTYPKVSIYTIQFLLNLFLIAIHQLCLV